MIIYLLIILGFVTLWVIILAGMRYFSPRPRPAGVTRKCCLEAPCSEACADRLTSLQDARGIQWDKVVAELGRIVAVGQSSSGENAA